MICLNKLAYALYNSSEQTIDEQKIAAVLNQYGVTDAALFGSFARGDAGPESDIDLLVTYKPGTNLFDVFDLQDALEKASGRKVDLVSKKYFSKRLAVRIQDDLWPIALS